MVSILPIKLNSTNLFLRFLEIVSKTPTRIIITVNFMFHSFFSAFGKIQLLVYLFDFLLFSLYRLLERQNPYNKLLID